MRHSLALGALVLALAGCGTDLPPGMDCEIVAAHLEGVSLWDTNAIVGYSKGSATLVATDTAGLSRSFPVSLVGPDFGLCIGGTQTVDLGGRDDFDLSKVKGPVMLSDLFGDYSGTTVGVVMVAGLKAHTLSNGREVQLDISRLAFWFQFCAAAEWMVLGYDG